MAATFVVEDGSGMANANAYCSVAFANQYHDDYGAPAAWTSALNADKERAIRAATRAADERYGSRWVGVKAKRDQSLDWPRQLAVYRSGWEVAMNEVPVELRRWTARAALLVLQGQTLSPETRTSAAVSSETKAVGPLSKSVTYVGAKQPETVFPALDRMLEAVGLVSGGGGWGYGEA